MNISLLKAVIGKLLTAYGVVMSAPLIMALYYKEDTVLSFALVALLTTATGLFLRYTGNMQGRLGIKDGLATVALAWILTCFLGSLPLYFSGAVPYYIDSLFEATSGLTATGATVISDVEALPRSILLWRSLTHWLGGLGIIVLFIVLLPRFGIGAVKLFRNEVTGPTSEKVMPKIRDTALTLWGIYVGLTLADFLLLKIAGMSAFDAINHAFSNMATGGFSTKNASIAHYDSLAIELIVTAFMIISGVNFTLYISLWRKGNLNILRNTELKAYLSLIFLASLTMGLILVVQGGYDWGMAFRQAVFQVTAIITTTGFVVADYNLWPVMGKTLLFFLMFIGGCAASTTGGIKISRMVLLVKMGIAQMKQTVHPQLVVNIEIQDTIIEPEILQRVARFFFLYISVFVCASFLLSITGLEPFEAMALSAASLGNVGPAFGIAGPASTYASVAPLAKLILSFCMLLGRLELITILVMLRPDFWKSKKSW